jgi:acetoin utilization protein AcuB
VIVMLVRQIMTRHVITIGPETPLETARRLLDQHRIRHLPVVVNDRVVGMVSDRDVRSASALNGRRAAVAGIMTSSPVTVSSETRVEDAARLLLDRKIGGLPVVDGSTLTGIVTADDLMRALVAIVEAATLERISVELTGARDA